MQIDDTGSVPPLIRTCIGERDTVTKPDVLGEVSRPSGWLGYTHSQQQVSTTKWHVLSIRWTVVATEEMCLVYRVVNRRGIPGNS